ncbi:DUF3127 domain-containing protein [Puniceicoccaceae bacterium K14]|nr:DUF3127 domain-containing protein [Puniceicoccaceae bacterium K14]
MLNIGEAASIVARMYEMEGTVKVIEDTQTFSSGFAKREFVVTSEDKFPQDIKFECTKEKIELVDKLKAGDKVKVSFNIRGNEYKGRYYVNLQAWRVENAGGEVDSSLANVTDSGAGSQGQADDFEDSPF